MKVLLVSDGPHELTGSLETLVRRLSPHQLEIDHENVCRRDIHTHRGKGQRYYKRTVRWLLEARKRGYEAIVLVVDEDGQAERVEEITNAQRYAGNEFRRAFGIAIRTFDAWMLADEQALTSVLGRPVQRQPEPENMKNPKQVCKELRDASGADIAQRQMYAQIAECVKLPLLEQRCPRSFAPFAARVRQL